MSLSAKRLRREHVASAAAVSTTTAFAGRTFTFNGGVGWRSNGHENTPVGMLLQNAVQIVYGYGEGLAIMPDRTVQVWGQNIGANVPWSVGPEGLWSANWGYRTNLVKQAELEAEGHSRAEIEAKERSFAIRILGQLIYRAGAIVTYEGGTWEALVENCATPPGTNPAVWILASPQIPQFRKPLASGGERWYIYAYNLAAPRAAPMLHDVVALAYAGSHGAALLADGSVRMYGKGIRWGVFGTGFEGSYGPKPRPLKPPVTRKFSFTGTLTAGSAVITNLEGTRSAHDHAAGTEKMAWGLGRKTGSLMLMPDPFTGLTGSAASDVFTLSKHGLENGTAARVSALTGGAGLSVGVTYYVIGATTNTFQLSTSIGGPPVNFTTDVTAGTLTVQGLPANAKVISYTDHEVLDEEGHKYVPERRLLDTITVDVPSAYGYLGKMWGKKPTREEKYWNIGEGSTQAAGWPVRPKLPTGAVCTAIATNGDSIHSYTLALTNTGEVLAWGSSNLGQMGDLGPVGETQYNLFPAYVKEAGGANLKNIVAIAVGEVFCMALNANHEVLVWGSIESGEAGQAPYDAKTKRTSTPLVVAGLPTTPGERPIAIVAAHKTCYVILENGKVMAWGSNVFGECGKGVIGGAGADQPTPALVEVLASVAYLEAGRFQAVAVTSAGDAYAWGVNTAGQLGIGTEATTATPTKVDVGGRKVLSVAMGEYNSIFVLDGSSALPVRLRVKLVPQGEVTGEPSAYLKLRWEAAFATGWKLSYQRQANWWEELEAEELREELEAQLESGELTAEEKQEVEEELELLEIEEEEREAKAVKIDITPTEVSPGVFEYEWISPGRLTPSSGYIVSLLNPTHPAWNAATVFTNGLWGSPYV